jgi:hypothetical protein
MKFLATAEIITEGKTVFTASSFLRGSTVLLNFHGELRVEHPYKHMQNFIDDLAAKLPKETIEKALLDFSRLDFCNSNGFYTIMDAIELVYRIPEIPIEVKRNPEDDWQKETLPILLNIEQAEVGKRTSFTDLK